MAVTETCASKTEALVNSIENLKAEIEGVKAELAQSTVAKEATTEQATNLQAEPAMT